MLFFYFFIKLIIKISYKLIQLHFNVSSEILLLREGLSTLTWNNNPKLRTIHFIRIVEQLNFCQDFAHLQNLLRVLSK